MRSGCIVCSGGGLWACCLCGRGIWLGGRLKPFPFLDCIGWCNDILVIGEACIVVEEVPHVWTSSGSCPAVCNLFVQ